MAKATVIDVNGKSTGTKDLPDALFGGEPNEAVMHQVVVAQLAAARSGTASRITDSSEGASVTRSVAGPARGAVVARPGTCDAGYRRPACR